MAQGDDYRATTAQQDIAFRQAQAASLKRKSMLPGEPAKLPTIKTNKFYNVGNYEIRN